MTKSLSFAILALMKAALILFSILFCGNFAHADKYLPINSNADRLQVYVDLIQQAHTSIDLAFYMWKEDETGLLLLALLRDAGDDGKQIRILVDGYMASNISTAMQIYLRAHGVQIKLYNPRRNFSLKTWVHHMHNKICITDSTSLVESGNNIDDMYFGLGENKNYMDRSVFLQGSAVGEAEQFYNSLWESDLAVASMKSLNNETLEQAKSKLDEAKLSLAKHSFLKFETKKDWAVDAPVVGTTHFFHDDPMLVKKRTPVTDQFIELLDQATESAFFENAYIVLTPKMKAAILRAITRGVHIRMLTNSARSTDGLVPQAAYINDRKEIVNMGVELWEYNDPNVTVHIKSAVIDRKITVISTYNLDYLSENQNLEEGASVEDESVAASVLATMDENLLKSIPIGLNGRPNGGLARYVDTPCSKILKTQFFRFLVAPFFRKLI